jgi:methanogenic corrinoid protein MtbC1
MSQILEKKPSIRITKSFSWIFKGGDMIEELHQKLTQAVIDGEPEDAETFTKEARVKELDPFACITQSFTQYLRDRKTFIQ